MKRESVADVEVESIGRRRYTADFKREVVLESMAPGASIAQVALSHGINANLLHTWRWQYRHHPAEGHAAESSLVAVHVARDSKTSGQAIGLVAGTGDIEVHLGAARIVIRGKPDGASLRCVFDALRS